MDIHCNNWWTYTVITDGLKPSSIALACIVCVCARARARMCTRAHASNKSCDIHTHWIYYCRTNTSINMTSFKCVSHLWCCSTSLRSLLFTNCECWCLPQSPKQFILTSSHPFTVSTSLLLAKCKGNVVPVLAITMYGGRRSTAPLILNLGTRWWWTASCPSHFASREGAPSTCYSDSSRDPTSRLDVSEKQQQQLSCTFQELIHNLSVVQPSLLTMSTVLPAATHSSYQIKMCKKLKKKSCGNINYWCHLSFWHKNF
jgi:hypothetical protein